MDGICGNHLRETFTGWDINNTYMVFHVRKWPAKWSCEHCCLLICQSGVWKRQEGFGGSYTWSNKGCHSPNPLTGAQIGRAHVGTQVTNAQLVCRILLEKTKTAGITTLS